MDKKLLLALKEILEKQKKALETLLESFAKKDKKTADDWDTRFPSWNGEVGSGALEKAADQVEEYSTLLPIEHNLELKLRDINLALEKIKKGKYGTCEKCGKKIDIKRLKISPEARFCKKCKE
jgi:DnaK suppressor protein